MTLRPVAAFVLVSALALLAAPAGARESLRLPWVFSDQLDLCADFSFSAGHSGKTAIAIDLGGKFANFGLPARAARAPRLDITCEFTAPSELEKDTSRLKEVLDLADVLRDYGLTFSPSRFGESSKLVYKAELATDLAPGDYNLRITLSDPALEIESRRTLHLIVPSIATGSWQVGDLKFITAVGQTLGKGGRKERVLDPNPWRQVGGGLGLDLLVAYTDSGTRPPGALERTVRIRRLRGDAPPVWQDSTPPPPKRADQVWVLRVPERTLKRWQGGVYLLEVEERCGGTLATAAKTFEVLP